MRETSNLVLGRVAGGQEDDRNLAAPFGKASRDLEAVEPRHHHVEHDQMGTEGLETLERLGSVGRGRHLEALVAKRHRQQLRDARLVVDDQDALGAVGLFARTHR